MLKKLKIDVIISIERDTAFDDKKHYRSGGIRLIYDSKTNSVSGLKEGILLEAGFDTVTPNNRMNITSWAFEKANQTESIKVKDNTAIDIPCYHPGYTLVEKLQTIATKFRQEQASDEQRLNYMRQYYDVYCLLENEKVRSFIGTEEYKLHKQKHFSKQDHEIPLINNEAFLLKTPAIRANFRKRYEATASLYYQGQPSFDLVIDRIRENLYLL